VSTRYRTSRALLAVALLTAPVCIAPAAARAESALQARGRLVEESVIDRQTREISSQLRCVVCQGLSLQDSPSQLAQEMRAIVREKLEEGMTPDEVKAFFTDRYGEWVMLKPEPKGFNLFVYVMPVLMFVGGAGFVLFNVRKWTAAKPDVAEDEEELQAR
jgi:cytochrome c-type biogenesis protein CcmH/NrfF